MWGLLIVGKRRYIIWYIHILIIPMRILEEIVLIWMHIHTHLLTSPSTFHPEFERNDETMRTNHHFFGNENHFKEKLVGGFNPSENYESNWIISPVRVNICRNHHAGRVNLEMSGCFFVRRVTLCRWFTSKSTKATTNQKYFPSNSRRECFCNYQVSSKKKGTC